MIYGSEHVQVLNKIQKNVFENIKSFDFRSRRRSLMRLVDGDIQHLIDFQAGRYNFGPPSPTEILNLRPNLYGKFTIEIAVFVPEVFERMSFKLRSRNSVNCTHCQIRRRLSLIASNDDIWWDLSDNIDLLTDRAICLINEFGIPFLNRFCSRCTIIEELTESIYKKDKISSAPLLDVAMIYWKLGKLDDAKNALTDHLIDHRKNFGRPQHEVYVRHLSSELGCGELNVA